MRRTWSRIGPALCLALLLLGAAASAEERGNVPSLSATAPLGDLAGKRIVRVEVVTAGGR